MNKLQEIFNKVDRFVRIVISREEMEEIIADLGYVSLNTCFNQSGMLRSSQINFKLVRRKGQLFLRLDRLKRESEEPMYYFSLGEMRALRSILVAAFSKAEVVLKTNN